MGKSYKELYDNLIGEKFRANIISYNPQSRKYKYYGYSHKVEDNALKHLSEMIIDDMIFYAFTENEILKLNNSIQILDDLRAAAKYAYVERLPKRLNSKSDGTMGETFEETQILDANKANVYYSVVSTYSQRGTESCNTMLIGFEKMRRKLKKK